MGLQVWQYFQMTRMMEEQMAGVGDSTGAFSMGGIAAVAIAIPAFWALCKVGFFVWSAFYVSKPEIGVLLNSPRRLGPRGD